VQLDALDCRLRGKLVGWTSGRDAECRSTFNRRSDDDARGGGQGKLYTVLIEATEESREPQAVNRELGTGPPSVAGRQGHRCTYAMHEHLRTYGRARSPFERPKEAAVAHIRLIFCVPSFLCRRVCVRACV
jgi:hypothetical protein